MCNDRAVVECDRCGKYIDNFDMKLTKHKIEGLSILYFPCPHCGYKYPVMFVDNKQARYNEVIRILQNDVEIKARFNKTIAPHKIKKLNRLLEESKQHQATLRDTHLTAVTDQLNKSE